jgi:aminoglycoside phosphotransferase (APT) family kinase protein
MHELEDTAVEVRQGEELSLATLELYLRSALGGVEGAMSVRQFPGGHSNLTYLVTIGAHEYVLRRPPFGNKVKSAHDMHREYRVLSGLNPVFPAAPKPLVFCEDQAIMGADFYLMERIKGMICRSKPPEGFAPTPEQVRETCVAMVTNLAHLHAIDWKGVGLESLQRKEGSFMQRQVEGWAKRYAGSQTDDLPEVDQALQWCLERIPEDSGAVVIHNDYKFDNVVLDPEDMTRILGVLDWEMSTIGDPLFDLGVMLSYWSNPGEPQGLMSTGCFLNTLPGSMTRAECAALYAELTGRDVSSVNYYLVFATIKLAVVLQQIYYRYDQGLTQDTRFAGLIDGVRFLGKRAAYFIKQGSI